MANDIKTLHPLRDDLAPLDQQSVSKDHDQWITSKVEAALKAKTDGVNYKSLREVAAKFGGNAR